jgi:hypothetical protein
MIHRQISEIAREIRKTWESPHYSAVPYIEAMLVLGDISEMYYCDPADMIVAYFLGNAQTWRGEDARRIKKELNDILKNHRNKK